MAVIEGPHSLQTTVGLKQHVHLRFAVIGRHGTGPQNVRQKLLFGFGQMEVLPRREFEKLPGAQDGPAKADFSQATSS
jgi:hypothetical protein